MIEIEQHVVSDLTAGVNVHTLKDINGEHLWYSCLSSCDEPRDDNCIFLEEQFVNFGYSSPVVFCEEGAFILNLATHVPDKHIPDIYKSQAWIPHRTFNLQITGKRFGANHYEGASVFFQGHRIEMPKEVDFGFIQFYCLPEACRFEGNLYGTKDLITFYVYRTNRLWTKMVQPPLINMSMPVDLQVYIAIVPGQRFQLITPSNISVDTSSLKGVEFRKPEERTLIGGTKVNVAMANCKAMTEYSEAIHTFHKSGKYSKCSTVVFPPLIPNKQGDLYMFMSEPTGEKGYVLLNQYISGVRIATDDPGKYVADEKYIELEQGDNEVTLRFTNPFRSIMLEKSYGYWWIDHRPDLRLDRLP